MNAALFHVATGGGSDLHLKVPSRPLMRRHGSLEPLEGSEPLEASDTETVLRTMLTDAERLDDFHKHGEVDFSYALGDMARFRVNAFRQRGSISLVCRAIPTEIKTIAELGLPR
ncbi:MAG: hypothetical protein WKF31_03380 [Thermoleophilaceae bacterium]